MHYALTEMDVSIKNETNCLLNKRKSIFCKIFGSYRIHVFISLDIVFKKIGKKFIFFFFFIFLLKLEVLL